eukprot:Skav221488  [mRNA]  locus=scaffold5554:4767:7091:- [translate_table: standard]
MADLSQLRLAQLPLELCAELRRTRRSLEDAEVRVKLWQHVQRYVPRCFQGRTLVGPHPSMRFLEYVPEDGESDHPLHADTPLLDPSGSSDITVLVYLSDFQGGELELKEGQAKVTIQPTEGMVVVFPHRLLHRAKALKHGTKQLLKVSVLFEEADMEEQLPKSQAGYAHSDGSSKPPPPIAGTKQDELRLLIEHAKKLNTDDALEQLLDFILLHDVNSEPWAQELLTSAFMSLTQALINDRLKLKAYRTFDSATVLHGHELCVLLGETLMNDLENGATLEVRMAALHGFLTLVENGECRRDAVLRALRSDVTALRLRALREVIKAVDPVYQPSLQKLVTCGASTLEVSLALQALSTLSSDPSSDLK